jgi:hypothetical protein
MGAVMDSANCLGNSSLLQIKLMSLWISERDVSSSAGIISAITQSI